MNSPSLLHRFATFVAGCTVLLVLAGSLVTSTGSGLSVPDWPTSYGWNMFSFPPSKWVGGILYEHGHRLIASTVGFLTIILAAWLALREPRRWMKWLGAAALGAVIAQGILGGLTVLFFLPAAISTAHAGLAEIFFCMTVAIALFTSPRWIDGYVAPGDDAGALDNATLRRAATTTTVLVYVQILVGATMRHTDAGLAIPDFPLMFGHLWPTHWDPKIAIHFAHRVGALVVTLAVATTAFILWRGSSHAPAAARRVHAPGRAAPRARRRADHARRADDPEPPRHVDQQRPRGLRRPGADDVAGADAADLAREVCGRDGRRPAEAGR